MIKYLEFDQAKNIFHVYFLVVLYHLNPMQELLPANTKQETPLCFFQKFQVEIYPKNT